MACSSGHGLAGGVKWTEPFASSMRACDRSPSQGREGRRAALHMPPLAPIAPDDTSPGVTSPAPHPRLRRPGALRDDQAGLPLLHCLARSARRAHHRPVLRRAPPRKQTARSEVSPSRAALGRDEHLCLPAMVSLPLFAALRATGHTAGTPHVGSRPGGSLRPRPWNSPGSGSGIPPPRTFSK